MPGRESYIAHGVVRPVAICNPTLLLQFPVHDRARKWGEHGELGGEELVRLRKLRSPLEDALVIAIQSQNERPDDFYACLVDLVDGLTHV